MSRRKHKERQRKQREKRKVARRAQPRKKTDLGSVDLRVRHPELAQPPVYVDASGHRIPDPFACLGLDPLRKPAPEAVQSAFRSALAATPPETAPERARELVEARDFLLEPGAILTRTLGDLRVPNPEHFLPGYVSRRAASAPPKPDAMKVWSSRSRLVAIMTLYALLEMELDGGTGPVARTGSLFD